MTAVCRFQCRGGARREWRSWCTFIIRRQLGRWLCSASALGLLLGCDGSTQPIADADASVQACEIGEEGCYCRGGGGCRDGLLCIAGRCLATERATNADPVTMSPRPAPQIPTRPGQTPPDPGRLIVVIPEAGDGGATLDAAAADADADASAAPGSAPVDASADGD